MGKNVGRFLLGAALVGLSFIPGLPIIAGISIKALFLTTGIGIGLGALRGQASRQGFALQPVISTEAPLAVVYGKQRLGLRYVDRRTYGPNNEHLWIVGALCHGSEDGTGIAGIDEIYFDDRLAVNAGGGIEAPFAGRLTFSKYLGTDAQVVDPTLNSTDAAAWPSTSKGKGVAYVILHLVFDPEVYPTGEPVITCMVRGQKVNDIRNGQTITAMTNATPVAVTTASAHGYTTGDRVTLYLANPATPQGFTVPQLGLFTITVTGSSTYTLDGTTAPGGSYTASSTKSVEALYSTNPACCLTDFLTSQRYGGGFSMDRINQSSFTTMANYYDESISKNSDTSTTGKRFECNGWLDVSQTVKDNCAQLLSSCRGLLIPEGGQFRLVTRRVVSPTSFTLNESNIVGDWAYDMPGIGTAPNVIEGVYVEPGTGPYITAVANTTPIEVTASAHGFVTGQKVYIYQVGSTAPGVSGLLGNWTITVINGNTFSLDGSVNGGTGYVNSSCRATADFPYPYQPIPRIWPRPGGANGFLTADNNYLVRHETSLPFTTDTYTAEQIIMVLLREARSGTTVQVTCREAALQLQVGDLVPVTHPTPGWTAKNFWVMAMLLDPATLQVRLSLLEYDANAYTLDALNTTPTPPRTNLPNPFTVAEPTDLVLTASDNQAIPLGDGSHEMQIFAQWTASTHPYIGYYEVEYRQAGTEAWRPAPNSRRKDISVLIGPVSEGISYDVRVRAVNTLGYVSIWIDDNITPTLATLHRSGSFWIDDFSSQTPGRRWIQKGGTGTFVDVYDPDSVVGGKLGRATGPVHMEHADAIPFDPGLLYVLRWRVRQLRDPASGSKTFSIGVAGLAQVPGQPGVFVYVNTGGQNSADNQHNVVANEESLPAGRAFTDYYAYIRGHAGGKVVLTSSMLTHSGLGNFSAANCVDGNTSPSQVGFDTNSAVAGAYLKIDLGVARHISEVRFHMAAADSAAIWDLEFSDDGTNWTLAP